MLSRARRPDAGRAHAAARAARRGWRPADDVDGAAKASPLFAKYGDARRRRSAREMLAARLEAADAAAATEPSPMEHVPLPKQAPSEARSGRRARRTASATSCSRARARRCSARSCAASSGCCSKRL